MKVSETGHAKNVANFEDLVSFCTGAGTSCNPSKAVMHIANLQALSTAAQSDLATLTNVQTAFIMQPMQGK